MSPHVYSLRKGAPSAPPEAAYVGGSTPFGNPFVIGRDGDREEVIAKFRGWVGEPEQEQLRAMMEIANG